jgi:hypothetical protein
LATDRKCIVQSNPQNFIWRESSIVFLQASRLTQGVELIITLGLEVCKSGRDQREKDSKFELHAELEKETDGDVVPNGKTIAGDDSVSERLAARV